MRVLHVVKTSEGAFWAAWQAQVLTQQGIEVHVAVPYANGKTIPLWKESGAHIHVANMDLPVRKPWLVPKMCVAARRLVAEVKPDLIHSHFVSTTLLLRMALGRNSAVPRLFQVPGPLHLEHALPKRVDLATAGVNDYWIGSSRCILEHYRNAGVDNGHLFLSYYGWRFDGGVHKGYLRQRLHIDRKDKIVGNINLIYPPKWFLGQNVGLKCHENVIDAIGIVQQSRRDVVGVLIGGTFGAAGTRYEESLKARAQRVGKGRILMPGYFDSKDVKRSWPDFDCAVHVPLSDNCGGVIEPLLAEVPTIASMVGGLPEVILDGVTGVTAPPQNPRVLASNILAVLQNPEPYRCMAIRGRKLVEIMFNVERTAREIAQIYRCILDHVEPLAAFSSQKALDEIDAKEPQLAV